MTEPITITVEQPTTVTITESAAPVVLEVGTQGPPGPPGAPGASGPQGAQGIPGPAGAGVNGNITISATPPASPAIGDVWIDISS